MVIRDAQNEISMSAVEWIPDNLPTAGDVRVDIEVSSQGFAGRASVWLDADRLRSFAQQLKELEQRREGVVELVSMSPGELTLQIRSVNRRGHMAVSGRVARHQYIGEKGPYLHSVEFGFEFDPTMLPDVLRAFESWIR